MMGSGCSQRGRGSLLWARKANGRKRTGVCGRYRKGPTSRPCTNCRSNWSSCSGSNDKILIILEGRDAAGKDGTIKRIVQHLSPRETRVVALGKPSDRSSWYFQRYAVHLPAAQELVLFNRSWYNRAGVERVMGFCSEADYEELMGSVQEFENMLVHSGVKLLKYYLDIGKAEQRKRLADRKSDPLKQWKTSPIDD